jgi:hypothetical protein
MPSATPDINCFVGDPYIGNDGNWHCQGDSVPPVTAFQLRKMNLPPFIKMQMALPSVKVDPSPTVQTLPYKNCLRHQAPPNFTYVYNPANGNCLLVALADAPRIQQQLNQQATGSGTTTSDAGSDILASGKNFVSQHPILTLALVAGAAYMFAGKGMKPKSREVVSTTKY